MKDFLPDATNFDDIPKQEKPDKKDYYLEGPWVECPLCKGHGYWNLVIDPRGPQYNFLAGCNQCNSWGWVREGSKDHKCVHKFREIGYKESDEHGIRHYGMFCHVYLCDKCGRIIQHDSSG